MTRRSRRVSERVADILEAIGHVRADIGAFNKSEFLADGKTQRAVIEGLTVIGEAANRIMQLDPDLEQKNPLLWQQLREAYDMRIVLTHEYFRVDAAIVWTTVESCLPELGKLLASFTPED